MQDVNILLVEDEKKIAESLSKGLSEEHFHVDIAFDGAAGKKLFTEGRYDLAIVDINLPLLNGYDLCTYIRGIDEEIRIIMVTALGATEDKLAGFHAGTDDYIVKPFDFKELMARIQVLLKRANKFVPERGTLTIADLQMNLDSREVSRGGRTIPLTAKEFQLLEYFIRNTNKMLSRADIAKEVWDIDFDTKTNVIDVYVNFLRRKIDRDFSPKLIHTHIGMGYIFKKP
jgi:two-component system copper resistance phosphate regulon response regulator CusR